MTALNVWLNDIWVYGHYHNRHVKLWDGAEDEHGIRGIIGIVNTVYQDGTVSAHFYKHEENRVIVVRLPGKELRGV